MEVVFGLLLLCALIAMVVGMFAPRLVLPARLRPGRLKVLGVYYLVIVATVSIGVALESPEKRAEQERVAEVPPVGSASAAPPSSPCSARAEPDTPSHPPVESEGRTAGWGRPEPALPRSSARRTT